MKLNQECIRAILLTVEDADLQELRAGLPLINLQESKRLRSFSQDEVEYNSMLLIQNEYISARELKIDYAGNNMALLNGLTWQGHQFLDTVRDKTVWKETKNILSKFSSVSLSMTENIASNVILGLIRKETNLPL